MTQKKLITLKLPHNLFIKYFRNWWESRGTQFHLDEYIMTHEYFFKVCGDFKEEDMFTPEVEKALSTFWHVENSEMMYLLKGKTKDD